MQEAFERGFQGHIRNDADDAGQWQVLPDKDFYQALQAEGAEYPNCKFTINSWCSSSQCQLQIQRISRGITTFAAICERYIGIYMIESYITRPTVFPMEAEEPWRIAENLCENITHLVVNL